MQMDANCQPFWQCLSELGEVRKKCYQRIMGMVKGRSQNKYCFVINDPIKLTKCFEIIVMIYQNTF